MMHDIIHEKININGVELLIDENFIKDATDLYINAQKIVEGLDLQRQIIDVIGYGETYQSMTKSLNNISREIVSNPLSKAIDKELFESLERYINSEPSSIDMAGSEKKDDEKKNITIDDILSFVCDAASIVGTGLIEGSKTYRKINFKQALKKEIENKKIERYDASKLNKIFESYVIAEYLNIKYNTSKIYNTVRGECISDYKSLKNANSQKFILDYVNAEFLKVKKPSK